MASVNMKPQTHDVEEAPPTVEPVEHPEKPGLLEDLDDDPVYSYEEQRKIIHRLDRRLIIITAIIYMNSLMDRSNLPNAGIAGMNTDLEMMKGSRYVGVAPSLSLSLLTSSVYCRPRLLRHIYPLPATGNTFDQEDWPYLFSLRHMSCVGRRDGEFCPIFLINSLSCLLPLHL